MQQTGYQVLSAAKDGGCPSPVDASFNVAPPYQFHNDASTSFAGGKLGYGDGCPAQYTLQKMKNQIARCGFSVVSIHPTEFTKNTDGFPLNDTQVSSQPCPLGLKLTFGFDRLLSLMPFSLPCLR